MERDRYPAVSAATAARRDPVIDLVRFTCLLLVVACHCMMVSPALHKDGTVTTENVLMEEGWFVPVAWALMIVPLFFVLGGVTGLQSWRRLKARGGTGFNFAQLRLLRLVRPAMALLAFMWGGLWVALLLGVHPQVIQLMTAGAAMPLWFLAAYLTAQVSVPLLARFHERAPLLTFGGLVALIITVDSLRGALPVIAFANMIFVWCAVQQLGFLMADGFFEQRSRAWLVGAIVSSNLLLGVATGVAVYPGNMVVNINPPNLCLLFLGISQTATLQLVRKGLEGIAGVRWIQSAHFRGWPPIHDRLPVASSTPGGHVRAAVVNRCAQTVGRDRGSGGGRGSPSSSPLSPCWCRWCGFSAAWRTVRRRPATRGVPLVPLW